MILYILYRIGYFIVMSLPQRIAYKLASLLADTYYTFAVRDRKIVINNLRIVLDGSKSEGQLRRMAREVFRNFAKYLVDFFSFSKMDQDYLKNFVKVNGRSNIDKALSRGKGVIMLSAHMGNWELGGPALSSIGYSISAVVLTHQNKRINDFFTRQRLVGKMKPIEIGISLKSCYRTLKSNSLLGLLGDRDFTKNGIRLEFFGNKALVPKGAALLSHRLGAAIVPSFMVRQDDDTFTLTMEEPIFPNPEEDEEDAVVNLIKKYLPVIESYVRSHPTQWFIFKNIWNEHDENLRPDTIL